MFTQFKNSVYRNFNWGRSNTYRIFIHFCVISFTIIFVLITVFKDQNKIGAINRFNWSFSETFGVYDLIYQGNKIELLNVRKPGKYFKIYEHIVSEGEDLNVIANKYNVNKDTIKWANQWIDYYQENIKIGDKLFIPEVIGVLYEVKNDNETLDEVLKKTSGDKFKVVEINQLEGPDFKLYKGQKILIPDGYLPKPPPPPPVIPRQNPSRVPVYIGQNIYIAGNIHGIDVTNPLSNPACNGYVFVRGFFPGHNGVDLAKFGGCPVRAIADGVVIFSGWSPWGDGYTVRIDHGQGIQSSYLHAETLWVSNGEYVKMGQEIMYMGTTGNSTGVHLHLSIKINGQFVDPLNYVSL
ncbi:MAG: M23 family metallopeptidase [Candidatus Dojkabacteria bacterium]|nr:M23 family metallopeptidase [Candidatus Dojkabacteria bacterium]